MKKFITVAALVAAGTAFANALTLNLDSAFSYWKSNVNQNADISAWNSVYGKTETEVEALMFSGTTQTIVNDARRAQLGLTTATQKTVSLSGLYGSSALEDSSYVLDSYSIIGSSNSANGFGLGVYSGNTLVGFSTTFKDVGGADSTFGALTFTQIYSYADGALTESALVLNKDTQYTFKIYSSNGTSDTYLGETIKGTKYYSAVSGSYNLAYGDFQMKWGSNTGGKLDGESNAAVNGVGPYHKPIVRLGVSTIPEPSAFGLLAGVGALALVAARRRRAK